LVIGGGIGLIVLLFQIWHKAHKTGTYAPAETPAQVAESSGFTPSTGSQGMFSPAPENIDIGATHIGGDSINMGSNLFPYFGYAVRSSSASLAYSTLDKLMQNNADYQNQQANVNSAYNTQAAQAAETEAQYQANAQQHRGK
jgi:hypothetical protein